MKEVLITRFVGIVLVIIGFTLLIISAGSSPLGACIATLGLVELVFGFIFIGLKYIHTKIF